MAESDDQPAVASYLPVHRPRDARRRLDPLTYVTTEDCHFCEHGRDVLDQLGIVRDEITADSAEAEQLAAAGIPLSFLPVLTDGRRVIAYGRFSEKRLRKELAV